MNTEEKIKKVINDGYIIADKITRAKSDEELNALSDEIDAYTNFVNTEFGKIDVFSRNILLINVQDQYSSGHPYALNCL